MAAFVYFKASRGLENSQQSSVHAGSLLMLACGKQIALGLPLYIVSHPGKDNNKLVIYILLVSTGSANGIKISLIQKIYNTKFNTWLFNFNN